MTSIYAGSGVEKALKQANDEVKADVAQNGQ